jgi:hypothetical protein
VLRSVEPDEQRIARVDASALAGLRAVRFRREGMSQRELDQPGLRVHFPVDSAESVAVAGLIAEPDDAKTHAEAQQLRNDLVRVGDAHMPVLAWHSRQHNPSTVYLAYAPPMAAGWWELVDAPLDRPAGHVLILAELDRSGFHWTPLESDTTSPRTNREHRR